MNFIAIKFQIILKILEKIVFQSGKFLTKKKAH